MVWRRRKQPEYDPTAGRELQLWMDNDEQQYKRYTYLAKNYERKFNKGKFNMEKAEKGVFNLLVTPAARGYQKEYGGSRSETWQIFNTTTRRGVAKAKTREIFRGLLNPDEKNW